MPGNIVSQKLDESLLEAMNNDSVVNNILQQDSALRVRQTFLFLHAYNYCFWKVISKCRNNNNIYRYNYSK